MKRSFVLMIITNVFWFAPECFAQSSIYPALGPSQALERKKVVKKIDTTLSDIETLRSEVEKLENEIRELENGILLIKRLIERLTPESCGSEQKIMWVGKYECRKDETL